MGDHRAVEVDLEIDREGTGRLQGQAAGIVADGDRLAHLDGAPRRVELDGAGALDQEHEGFGGAVHDRHLRGGDPEPRAVDLERKSTRLNSSQKFTSRMPASA